MQSDVGNVSGRPINDLPAGSNIWNRQLIEARYTSMISSVQIQTAKGFGHLININQSRDAVKVGLGRVADWNDCRRSIDLFNRGVLGSLNHIRQSGSAGQSPEHVGRK